MNLIVAGGRDFSDFELGFRLIDKVTANTPKEDITIICGRASGADTCGEEWYKLHKHEGVKISIHVPDWDDVDVEGAVIKINRFGKPYNAVAGHWRNSAMESESTHLIAIWDEVSTGTKDMIKKVKSSGKPYRVFSYGGKLLESDGKRVEDWINK